jgi:folylpolyglutamate synthase
MPRYRQFLMLLSFHVFVSERVDVAIYETHVGGEFDCTNVVVPVVTGITAIGMDHVRALGPSIENIAWHKAGIIKRNVPAFSDHQEPAVAEVLQLRAAEKNALLKFIDVDPDLPEKLPALEPNVQRKNASLGRALADTFLRLKAPESQNLVAQDIFHGIEHFFWPGRFQKIVDGNCQWFLDIAHNEMSLLVAGQWFAQQVSDTERCSSDELCESNRADLNSNVPAPPRILIFTHTSGQSSGRDNRALMKSVANPLQARGIRYDHVIITTLKQRQSGAKKIGMAPSTLT